MSESDRKGKVEDTCARIIDATITAKIIVNRSDWDASEVEEVRLALDWINGRIKADALELHSMIGQQHGGAA